MTSGALIDTSAGDRVFALEGGLSTSFAVGLGLAIAIEGVVLHLWIAPKSQLWAWAIAAFNALTLVWLWWEHRSAARSRLIVTPSDIRDRRGQSTSLSFPAFAARKRRGGDVAIGAGPGHRLREYRAAAGPEPDSRAPRTGGGADRTGNSEARSSNRDASR